MYKISSYLILAVMSIFVILSSPAAADGESLTLSEAGKSAYTIVIPDNATEAELHAADELNAFLAEISGADLLISTETEAPDGPGIHVGPTKKALDLIGAQEYSSLGKEGFILKTQGHDLLIVGGRPRGSLYGVYGFLEKHLGCRWYAPGASVIPETETITIPSLDEKQTPAFEYREPFFKHAFDADWAARNMSNGTTPKLKAKHGGKISYSHFVHTFNGLVPPDKYYDEHPEYFSLINGKRWKEKGQLCLSNPEVLEIAKTQLLQWMRGAPDATIFSVSQNDNMNACQCEKCRAIDREEGSQAGTLLRFVNAIADAAAEEFPDKYISTLAYQYTENVPRITKPRPNVIIRLCHMAPGCDTHPLNKCLWNEKYVRNLKAWRKIADKIYIWHYVTNFSHYPMLFPDVRAIASDMPFYHENGVDGMFAQGSYQSLGGNMAELKAWLIAKLLWNPGADAKELIYDFMTGYYGPAADPMLDYFYAVHRKTFEKTAHAHLYSSPTPEFMDRETLLYADECFNRAESMAADSQDHLARVRQARLGLTYVKLVAPHLFGWQAADLGPGDPQDQAARLDRFKQDLSTFNVTLITEMKSFDESLEWMRESIEKQVNTVK